MECPVTTSLQNAQEDLIDFNSDSEVVEQNVNIQLKRNKSAPMLKSTDRLRFNSDVVAIKRGNGEVAFVAVGRKKSHGESMKQNMDARDQNRDFRQIHSSSSGPLSSGGIVNLGYTTVTRGETYVYDQTGYFCPFPLNSDKDVLMNENETDYQLYRDKNDSITISSQTLPRNFEDVEIIPVFDESRSPNTSEKQTNQDIAPQPEEPEENLETVTALEDDDAPIQSTTELATDEPSPSLEEDDTSAREQIPPKLPPHCKSCGQRHGVTENHEFDYVDDVDEDLTCDICLQPLVDPYDTKCGHTFCCVCIKNYLRVKHMCPIDRQEMENTSSDCWQSSLLLRKLINKLMVKCPNQKFCKETMQRSALKDHLKERCPGAITRCSKSMYGCTFKSARVLMKNHLEKCEFKDFDDDLSELHPFCEDKSVELFRPEGTTEMGIMIVGGSDTPLHYVIIQDILPESPAEQDGRLHAGDIIVEINGESMYSVTHAEARAALTKPSNLMHFGLLREVAKKVEEGQDSNSTPTCRSSSPKSSYYEETVCLIKPPLEQLGIRISTSETGAKGVYIIELISGQVAHADGRLQIGDRIMAIGATDLSESTPEQAARVIGSCNEEVQILVRHMDQKPSVFCNEWAQEKTLPRKKKTEASTSSLSQTNSFPAQTRPVKSTHTKKIISVKKSPKENLGIIVSGGFNSPRGNLPIFVQDVLPMSILGKDKRIKRGDLLLQINSFRLVGLTHNQAMNILRECAQQGEVSLVVYELDYDGKAEDEALWDELTSFHQHPSKWAPSWKMWLSVTSEFVVVKDVILRKSPSQTYGLKFSGSAAEESGPMPIFVTHVAQNSPAKKYLKSGDEIIAVNKRYVKGIPYINVLNLLKTLNYVSLKVVSWPGSLH